MSLRPFVLGWIAHAPAHYLQRALLPRLQTTTARIKHRLLRLLPPLPLAGFVLAVMLVIGNGFVNHNYVAGIRHNYEYTAQERDALGELREIEQQLGSALSAVRAFVLTRNDYNRRTYNDAAGRALRALRELMAEPSSRASLDLVAIGNVTRTHLEFMQRVMAIAEQNTTATTLLVAGQDIGSLSMVAVNLVIEHERAKLEHAVELRKSDMVAQLRTAEWANWLSSAALLGVLLAFGWLMIGFLHQRNRATEALRDVNARLEETVATRTAQLAELSQHLLTVREEERAALAQDIHDQIGSELSAVIVDTSRIETLVRAHHVVPDAVWARLKATLHEMTTAHRRIINSLHPTVLDHLGLPAAVHALIEDLRQRADIAADLQVEGRFDDLPKGLPIAIYRIVQEAITNVIRHARAASVHTRLVRTGDLLVVEIADDGIGLDPQARTQGRLGVVGMRERAHKLGGVLKIVPGPRNRGTCVTATFRLKGSRQ